MSDTPILDLEIEPLKARTKLWLSVPIGAVLGFLLASTSGLHVRYLPGLNGFLFLPALYIAVAVHEFGHLIAGSIVGMPPGGLVIGGIVILKSGQHWSIRFDYRRIFGGGLAKVLPEGKEFRPGSYALMIAGGPIASILLALACSLVGGRYSADSSGWIGSIFWLSLLATIVSLVPYSAGTNKSDGARLWTLARHPEQSRRWMAVWALQTEETRGVRPREWDEELVHQMLETGTDDSGYTYVQLLAYYRQIDQGNTRAALDHLENTLTKSARCQKIFRQCIFLEAAGASAFYRNNAAQARTWLARAGKVHKPMTTDGAEMAIAICEKRYEDALRFIAASRIIFEKRKLDSGLARFAKEKLQYYEDRCRTAMAKQSGLTADNTLTVSVDT